MKYVLYTIPLAILLHLHTDYDLVVMAGWFTTYLMIVFPPLAPFIAIQTGMFSPAASTNKGVKAAGIEDIELPTADVDRVVPEIFGTVLIQPNLIWAGDFKAQKLQVKQESGGGGS